MISFEDFKKIDLRIAKIIEAERVEGSEKLIRLQVDFGGDSSTDSEQGRRQIVAGIGKAYSPENLIGKKIVVVANLEPRFFTLRSDSGQVELESQGMLLAAGGESGPVLLIPDNEVESGSAVS